MAHEPLAYTLCVPSDKPTCGIIQMQINRLYPTIFFAFRIDSLESMLDERVLLYKYIDRTFSDRQSIHIYLEHETKLQ